MLVNVNNYIYIYNLHLYIAFVNKVLIKASYISYKYEDYQNGVRKNIYTIPFLRSILSVKKCVLYTKNMICNAWISVVAENCVVVRYAVFRCCLSRPDIFLERSDTATNGKFILHKLEIYI